MRTTLKRRGAGTCECGHAARDHDDPVNARQPRSCDQHDCRCTEYRPVSAPDGPS